MDNIPSALKSRKFWLTVSALIALIVNEEYTEAVALVTAYIFAQGAIDGVEKYQSVKQRSNSTDYVENQEDDVDTSKLISGEDLTE